MSLTLISAEPGYNVYRSPEGDEILGTPMPVVAELALWEDFDILAAWGEALADLRRSRQYYLQPSHAEFVAGLRRVVADTDSIDIVWCENCLDPAKREECRELAGGASHVCDSCYADDYLDCSDCGDVHHYDGMTYMPHGEPVCDSCRGRYYSYCEDCDEWYHDDCADDHHHGGCDCESPAQHFAMRHGGGTVEQDARFNTTLSAGVISNEGLWSISRLIRNHGHSVPAPEVYSEEYYLERNKWWNLAQDVAKMDPTWQTREGNFTKRLSKLAHKTQGLKLPPEIMTQVGNIGRDNSSGADLSIELTRDLNLPAEDFYHEDSCWWQSYSDSRCSLKQNGGIGMRTFSEDGYVQGRAWIMPLNLTESGRLVPTFDAVTADAYMVFNGYGDLSGYAPARIVADMAGMTYRKVQFECSPMYVNGNAGYLVTTEDIAQKFPAASSVRIHADTHSNLFHTEQAAARQAELVGV